MALITFNEQEHIYKVEGVTTPSTTQIINPPADYDIWYAERGRAIHKACELHMLGQLDTESIDPVINPYYEAFLQFLDDTKSSPINGVLDIKSGVPQAWHSLQIAAYYELWRNGLDENNAPLVYVNEAYEIRCYHPLMRYCGTIDMISIADKDKPIDMYLLYLRDNGKYILDVVSSRSKTVNKFLALASAYHIRQEFAI